MGLFLVKTFAKLADALARAFGISQNVLVEEYVRGREATCGVVNHFRGEETYALPPIEIRTPADRDLFDYEAKYTGVSEEICPGHFNAAEKAEIEKDQGSFFAGDEEK